MTPYEFIQKWKTHALTERASAQEHFIDLCRLMNHPTPAEDDPSGERFTFEKGVMKTGGGDGYADVWKKGYFALEYKKKKRDLDTALVQLTRYAAALENPPLHIACDTVRFIIETRWTNSIVERHEFELDHLAEPENLAKLQAVFHNPEALRPIKTRADITREAADKFQTISDRLQHRHLDREAVAHFVNQLVFCFFADSVKLLPDGLWRKLLEHTMKRPEQAKKWLDQLFGAMETGGDIDFNILKHFNGGLFAGSPALPLQQDEIALLLAANNLNWGLIDPTIFGTLFERFLDPDKRAQIGAHYTDASKIMMIIEPVIARPLEAEWQKVRAEISALMTPVTAATTFQQRSGKSIGKTFEAARSKAETIRDEFLEQLGKLRILDPACGSGNFLYLALQVVKDIEYKAILDCETMGLGRTYTRVGPEILHGIEINTFAAELARTTIWIGDIQWELRNAIMNRPEPILRNLNTIECRDALLTKVGEAYVEAEWPEVDYIVGNPPFLGGKKLRRGLDDANVDALFSTFEGVVPHEADLVCYWFAKAWKQISAGKAKTVGLVSTNSIRGGANRKVLQPIAESKAIFEAWSDEAWVVDGASVRVSLVCFGTDKGVGATLDGHPVKDIFSDLTGASIDLTTANSLQENLGISFMGYTKGAPFEVPRDIAVEWLTAPMNPNGRRNTDVLFPIVSGGDIAQSNEPSWVIDFNGFDEAESALFEGPFEYVLEQVRPVRELNNRELYRKNWWLFAEARSGFRNAISNFDRYIATPKVSKHRFFVWLPKIVAPDNLVILIARDDDAAFGIVSSKFHESWSLAKGAWIGAGNDPTYTPTTTFATFPFPAGLTPNIQAKDYVKDPRAIRIALAAKKLDDLRRNWLNPPDLVDIVPEVVPGYPDRILPKNTEAAIKLKSRTLTNLYNQRPQWLGDAHASLDRAVAVAYGWPEDISTEEALAKLLALNLERAGK